VIAHVARRLAQAFPLALAVVSFGFLLVHLAPGDAVVALSGEFAHEDVQRELREHYGLDRGLAAQYVIYLRRCATGDLGRSFYFQQPVARVILERLPATLLLVLPSLALSTALGILGGALLAGRKRARRARGVLAAAVASNAVPVFWLAQLMLLAFAVRLGLFPVQGMIDARSDTGGIARIVDLARHAVLPVAAMTLHQLALVIVLTWTNLEEELGREYVRAARARGLGARQVRVHALRNALLPVITAVGGRVGSVFSGAVLTETVFAWPGLGRLAVLGATNRDFPLVLGLFLFMTVAVLVANLLTDITATLVDPRIRLQ
jgi:peptide/nickel transport system permease protein